MDQRLKRGSRLFIRILLFISAIGIALQAISAAPPTPHTISGYIFYSDGIVQVPLGTGYSLNDTNTSSYIESVTSLPIAGRSGYYSQTIQGANGDNVSIAAWNDSNYGFLGIILAVNMKDQNFTIGLPRYPEPTVNITFPNDNAVFNDSSYFQVFSRMTLYGNASSNCVARILFSNPAVASMYASQPSIVSFGSLSRGFTTLYAWNISPLSVGKTNITVNFTCDGELLKFEKLNNTDVALNISINDSTPPSIALSGPNNDSWLLDGNITFNFTVNDFSNISNCSLYLDGAYNQAVQSPTKNATTGINSTASIGIHAWNITCMDVYNFTSWSQTYRFNVAGQRNIYVERQSYIQGETARFYGYNWSDGNVSMVLTRSDLSQYIFNATAANGMINTTYWINYSDGVGDFNMTAIQDLSYGKNASVNFSVVARLPALNTAGFNFGHNEAVQIFGFNFSVFGTARVLIFSNYSGQIGPGFPRYAYSNSSGDFNLTWNTTDVCAGIYGIFAGDMNWTPYNATAYINLTDNTSCTEWNLIAPNITFIRVDDLFPDMSDEIDLLSGQTTRVFCNITVFDQNKQSDISFVNATFFFNENKSSEADDNNTHYTAPASSCGFFGSSEFEKYFLCEFNATYYAKNGTWMCNATAVDISNLTDTEIDSAKINLLYAIDVSPVVDYGIVAPGNESGEVLAVVTNKGNVEIDLGLHAYAVVDEDNMSMMCTTNTNISLDDQRYDLISGNPFASMTPVNGSLSMVDLNLSKQVTSSLESKNLYWMLRIPTPQSGICNGSVVFTAI